MGDNIFTTSIEFFGIALIIFIVAIFVFSFLAGFLISFFNEYFFMFVIAGLLLLVLFYYLLNGWILARIK